MSRTVVDKVARHYSSFADRTLDRLHSDIVALLKDLNRMLDAEDRH